MSKINIHIDKKIHQIPCDPEQEEKLKTLAQKLEKYLQFLTNKFPNLTEIQKAIMAAMMILDEKHLLEEENHLLQKELADFKKHQNKPLSYMMRPPYTKSDKTITQETAQKDNDINIEELLSVIKQITKKIETLNEELTKA